MSARTAVSDRIVGPVVVFSLLVVIGIIVVIIVFAGINSGKSDVVPRPPVPNTLVFDNATPTLPIVWQSVSHVSVDMTSIVQAWSPTQDFTVEWFQYLSTDTYNPVAFSLGYNDSGYPYTILGGSWQGPQQQHQFMYVQTADLYQAPIFSDMTIESNWVHVALVRDSGTMTVYMNGQQKDQFSLLYDMSTVTGASLTLGNAPYPYPGLDTLFTGNISNFRITDGPVYTSSFAVPSVPYPSTPYTVSLYLRNATSATAFVDSGTYSLPVAQSNVGWQTVS